MRRRQLVELEDLAWFPRAVRDGGTDWLGFMANLTGMLSPIAPKIREAMHATGSGEIVDLCSGGGGPWLTLERELAKSGTVRVTLSDLYPNAGALSYARARSDGRLDVRTTPVDATDVPADLTGVRTMFSAFHHFPPDVARSILADAVRQRRAIVVVEAINSRAIGLAGLPLQIPAILVLTPFVRPFRWSRLLFTYLIPLIPLLVLFDGTVSMLRIYQPDELRALVAGVPGHESYTWDIGEAPGVGPIHLVGTPRDESLITDPGSLIRESVNP